MKFSTSLSSILVILPLISMIQAASIPLSSGLEARAAAAAAKGAQKGQQGQAKGGKANQNKGQKGQKGGAANKGNANKGNANKGNANKGNANKGNANKGNANKGQNAGAAGAAAGSAANSTGNANNDADAQTSLTLDPRVIAKGFANNGQDVPEAGQVASLTSTNNFINFCLTVPNLPLTNGQQIRTGSCNPAPIGTIPNVNSMPSAKFVFPKNGDNIDANKEFTITMNIKNLEAGNFVNANENYFAAPQQLNNQGLIVGHSHVVVEKLSSITQTDPTDPTVFAFFKGLNAAAVNGALTADVTAGLDAGSYRLCSINTAANHQPAIVPIAQHGSLDDCVYFTVGGADGDVLASGAAAGAAAAGNNAAAGAAAGGKAGAAAAGKAGAAAGAAKGGKAGAAAGAAKGGKAGAAAGAAKGGKAGAAKGGNAQKGQQNKGQQAKGAAKGQAAKGAKPASGKKNRRED